MSAAEKGTQPLAAAERRSAIVRIVAEREYCVVSDLASELGVSSMTIRRDLVRLAAADKVTLYHGVVRSAHSTLSSIGDFSTRQRTHSAAKSAIARRAIDFVEPGAVIAFDAGTTVAEVARLLPATIGVRVVTSSLAVLEALFPRSGVEITTLGGLLRRETLSFIGADAVAAIAELHFTTMFLAAASLSSRGAFDVTDLDATVKRAMIDAADRVILLADSSKFRVSAMARICTWNEIDTVITDSNLTAADAGWLTELGVSLVIAELPRGASDATTIGVDN